MADIGECRQEVYDARTQVESAADQARDAVYNEKPIKAEIAFGEGLRACQRWKRAERRLDAAISEVAEAVPYA